MGQKELRFLENKGFYWVKRTGKNNWTIGQYHESSNSFKIFSLHGLVEKKYCDVGEQILRETKV